MRIKEVVQRTGLTEKTIRYYESCGLVIPDLEERNGRLWRDYTNEHVRKLSAVATLRRASFQVEEIATLMDSPGSIPEILKAVRTRTEESWAALGELRERLRQEELKAAPDIYALASKLDKAASGLSLPVEDLAAGVTEERKLPVHRKIKRVAKARSLSAVLARKLVLTMAGLWILTSLALIFAFADDLQRQGKEAVSTVLEDVLRDYGAEYRRLENGEHESLLISLPEPHFTPKLNFPLLKHHEMNVLPAALIIDETLLIAAYDGFDIGSLGYFDTSLTVREGKLFLNYTLSPLGNLSPDEYESYTASLKTGNAAIANPGQRFRANSRQRDSYPDFRLSAVQEAGDASGIPNPFLTFSTAPLRKGSFPSAEIPGDFPGMEGYDPLQPTAAGNQTPISLLDGIESGILHFDSDGLLQSSQIRGLWIRDESGSKQAFILAAYGWSPLLEVVRALPAVLMLSFLLYQLLGAFIWFSFQRSLIQPMLQRAAAMIEKPIVVSCLEYDYQVPYVELRKTMSADLLRCQMQQAAASAASAAKYPIDECPRLLSELERAEGTLLPILLDRGQKITREFHADGQISAKPEQLQDALLALFREVIDFTEQNEKMRIHTMELSGFLMTEIAVNCKRHMKAQKYAHMWDGIYRSPADGNAPGAKLRRAMCQIPGSFAAVSKTRQGLALTLGLPLAG